MQQKYSDTPEALKERRCFYEKKSAQKQRKFSKKNLRLRKRNTTKNTLTNLVITMKIGSAFILLKSAKSLPEPLNYLMI